MRLGVMLGSGGTPRLPWLAGLAHAKELILLGKTIDTETAHRIGLVNHIAGSGKAEAVAIGLAETLASRGPIAIRETKAALDAALDASLDEGLFLDLAASERVFSSDDMLEGTAAFLEKRAPRFNNP